MEWKYANLGMIRKARCGTYHSTPTQSMIRLVSNSVLAFNDRRYVFTAFFLVVQYLCVFSSSYLFAYIKFPVCNSKNIFQ